MDVAALAEPVAEIIRDVAARSIRPRFRALAEGDVAEKTPGEVVTIADREAEAAIVDALRALAPGVPAVGEEAAATDPSVVAAIAAADHCWLVDPLDGTANFVAGSPDHAVMVALLRAGVPVGAWVWQPEHEVMWSAERGGGTRRDGEPAAASQPRPLDSMRVAVLTRFFDQAARDAVESARPRFGSLVEGPRCAGVVYPRLVEGRYDAVLFGRTLPWDHAPGSLLVTEAGGAVARPDGTPYVVGDDRSGLLATASAQSWRTVRDVLRGGAA